MHTGLAQWAAKYDISQQAVTELLAIFGCIPVVVNQATGSESKVSSDLRLEAARKGLRLWRNNSGVLKNPAGVPVRFGLANESARLNEKLKSADFIGWRPILITPAHVGLTIAQFLSRECKKPGWKYTGKDREPAQLRWAELVTAEGGDARFCSGEETL